MISAARSASGSAELARPAHFGCGAEGRAEKLGRPTGPAPIPIGRHERKCVMLLLPRDGAEKGPGLPLPAPYKDNPRH